MSFARESLRGLETSLRGLGGALRSKPVRAAYLRLFLVYALVALLLDALAVWGAVSLTAGPLWGLPELAITALRWLGVLAGLLVAPFVALFLVNLGFPVLGERLFLAGLQRFAPELAGELAAAEGLPFSTGAAISLRRLVGVLGFGSLLFVWSLVPVVGNLTGPVLGAYFGASALGWELLDPYFDKRQLRYVEQRAFLQQHRATIVGFSLPMALLLAVPLIGPLFFGWVQASAAALVVELTASPPSAGTGDRG